MAFLGIHISPKGPLNHEPWIFSNRFSYFLKTFLNMFQGLSGRISYFFNNDFKIPPNGPLGHRSWNFSNIFSYFLTTFLNILKDFHNFHSPSKVDFSKYF